MTRSRPMPILPHDGAIFAANVRVCLRCDHRDGQCPDDGVIVNDHANSGYCPRQLFAVNRDRPAGFESLSSPLPPPAALPASQFLPGDFIAAVAERIGAGEAARRVAALLGWADCGCPQRKEWINRWYLRACSKLGFKGGRP